MVRTVKEKPKLGITVMTWLRTKVGLSYIEFESPAWKTLQELDAGDKVVVHTSESWLSEHTKGLVCDALYTEEVMFTPIYNVDGVPIKVWEPEGWAITFKVTEQLKDELLSEERAVEAARKR